MRLPFHSSFSSLRILFMTFGSLLITAAWANHSPSQSHETSTFSITTYNLGLAYHFVPLAQERRPHLLQAIQELDSDVLCLQEIWRPEDMEEFKKTLEKHYPYSFYVPPKQKFTTKAPACYPTDLIGQGKFGTCLLSNCRSKKGDEFTDCVVQTCREEMDLLKKQNNECAAALFAQVGKSMLKGLMTVLNPFSKVGLYAYDGAAGVMLLSKLPLENTEVLEFQDLSTSNRRLALYAQVKKASSQRQHLLCTHLSADLSKTIPYTGSAKSWEDENFRQVQGLISFLEKKAEENGNGPQFVMGDFNCSLRDDQAGIAGEFEGSCQTFLQKGFKNPLLQNNPECSFCTSNTLVSPIHPNETGTQQSEITAVAGGEKSDDVLIDHIWMRNLPDSTRMEGEILFKELIKIDSLPPQNLSDHFGVKAEVYLP